MMVMITWRIVEKKLAVATAAGVSADLHFFPYLDARRTEVEMVTPDERMIVIGEGLERKLVGEVNGARNNRREVRAGL